jgi:hypothetical protein
VHSGSSIILEEDVHSQHEQEMNFSMPHCYQPKSSGISLEVTGIKRNVSSEHPRLQRKNSLEFDFASEIPNTKDAILSQRDAVVQYESSIKQTLSYNGDIAITSASDKAKISQLHSSLSPRKATISSALEKKPKLDKSIYPFQIYSKRYFFIKSYQYSTMSNQQTRHRHS